MPWCRASLQLIHPLRLSSQSHNALTLPERFGNLTVVRQAVVTSGGGGAAREHRLQGIRLVPVDAQSVSKAHLQYAVGEPTAVEGGHLAGRVV